jgi:hypothetical protein
VEVLAGVELDDDESLDELLLEPSDDELDDAGDELVVVPRLSLR